LSHPDEIDPGTARTTQEFARDLRRLRAAAGEPSLRELDRRARRRNRRLPRSTVADALKGQHLPRRALMLHFIQACGVDPAADSRWLRAWTRLAQGSDAVGRLNPATEPAAVVEPAAVRALVEAQRMLGDAAQARRAAELEIVEVRAAAQWEIDRLHADAERLVDEASRASQLDRDAEATGLLRIGATYLRDLDWGKLFAGVRELDVFMAYGHTWRNLHAVELAHLAGRDGCRIRVFLADPDDEMTMSTLARRFVIGPKELRARIEATRISYVALRQPSGADIEVYYWAGDRVFSCFRLDGVAVVGFYSHSRSRASAVPMLLCQQPGEVYQFIVDELAAIARDSRPT
jgi:hypothetical protein